MPSTEEGGYFVNEISLGFGVNKNSKNLKMVNEFMRFLVSTGELNEMAKAKRLVTPCVDMSLDSMYVAFGKLDAQRISTPRFMMAPASATLDSSRRNSQMPSLESAPM